VEKHLVVSIGDESYLALPKGGVSDTHVLVVPTEHAASLATLPPAAGAEVARFTAALRAAHAAAGLGTVAFERVLHRGEGRGAVPLHTQLQVVGVPAAAAAGAAAAFVAEGRYKGIAFEDVPPDAQLRDLVGDPARGTVEYLYVEAPGEGAAGVRRLLHRVPPGARHPIQFGREVLCRLLNAPERIAWKSCAVGVEVETAQAAAVRAGFAPFDFTLSL
jgi:diadenosine tetraphosphate (Ap4A) HIT family hydrolase